MGFAFVQPSVTINLGDTVTWTNKDAAAHSAVVSGVGQTPVLAQNASGSLTFNVAGTFPYVCGIHGASMMGTVIVRAAATPPPTPVPTPVPTVRQTIAPTPAPTVTSAPTEQPTPVASPSPTVTASAAATTTAPATSPSAAVAAPTDRAAPAAANDGGGPSPLLIAGAAIAAIAVVAFALTRIRR